jgi:hypothetical protein
MSIHDRIAALGIQPGDTIETRLAYRNGFWTEYRLKLLWVGEQIAVWRSWTRHTQRQKWSEPRGPHRLMWPPTGNGGRWRGPRHER